MKLTRLSVSRVRGLRDATFDLAPGGAPQDRVVVTGPPQAGLTSFLVAVAATAARLASGSSAQASSNLVSFSHVDAEITSRWWLDEDEQLAGGLASASVEAHVRFPRDGLGRVDADPALLRAMSRYAHDGRESKVVFFGERRVVVDGVAGLRDFVAEQRRHHLSEEPSKFATLPAALVAGDARLPPGAAERMRELFDRLAAPSRLRGVHLGRVELTSPSGARIPLAEASFGERSAFALAAATVLLGLSRAVVLLDQPEIGAPPHRVLEWIDHLAAAAPGSQWIVATRSEGVIAAAPPSAVVRLGDRS